MQYDVVCADVLEWAATYDGEPFHAILCDPPYEMNFMHKGWDGTGIAFQPETWAALAQHLLPGGFLMAFGGARTYHRLACAIEDAGLTIHSAMGWLNGQGFPKATRIDTQIDKQAFSDWLVEHPAATATLAHYKALLKEAKDTEGEEAAQVVYDEFLLGYRREAGLEREVVDRPLSSRSPYKADGERSQSRDERWASVEAMSSNKTTLAATDLARAWEGHRYGKQAIKPALEFIALAQKPYEGRPVDSIVETGAGALNIDGGRIGYTSDRDKPTYGAIGGGGWSGKLDRVADFSGGPNQDVGHSLGRWPANFTLCHLPGCVREGTRRVKSDGARPAKRNSSKTKSCYGDYGGDCTGERIEYHDSDGLEEVENWICVEGCPIKALEEQSGNLQSGNMAAGTKRKNAMGYAGAMPDKTLSATIGDKGTAARFYHNADWSYEDAEKQGRWPANFVLCHLPDCVHVGTRRVKAITGTRAGSQDTGIIKQAPRGSGEKTGYADGDGLETVANWICVEDCPIRRLGEQSGELSTHAGKYENKSTPGMFGVSWDAGKVTSQGNKGTAARFYFNADWSYEDVEQKGRWPANFTLTHLPGCVRDGVKRVKAAVGGSRGAGGQHGKFSPIGPGEGHDYADDDGKEVVENWICVEGCPVKALGEQSGRLATPGPYKQTTERENGYHKGWSVKGKTTPHYGDEGTAARFYHNSDWSYEAVEQQGRWPANFTLTHLPGCVREGTRRVRGSCFNGHPEGRIHTVYGKDNRPRPPLDYVDADGKETVENWQCVEGCPVKALGEQSGERKSCTSPSSAMPEGAIFSGRRSQGNLPMDKGTAARFYHNSDWSYEITERIKGEEAIRYQAKAGRKERDAGLGDLADRTRHRVNPGGLENEPRWAPVQMKNDHPTVKPIALTQWLATLLLPPDIYAPRRILIPFGGVASEGIGAMLAQWEHITLVEKSSDYCDIARARMDWWIQQALGQMWPDVKEILKKAKTKQ